jgi:hypothetical protein
MLNVSPIIDRRAREDRVRGDLQEASGEPVPAESSTPGELLATIEAYGADMGVLRIWIYQRPKRDGWTPRALAEWLEEKGFRSYPLLQLPDYCEDCGAFLQGGATRHAEGCFMRRLIIENFPGATIH